MHQLLMASNSDTYKPFQDTESRAMLWEYLHSPDKYYQHGARFANSVIFSVVFGRRTSMKDENTRLLFSTIDDFMDTQRSPSASLIEQFPWVVRNLPRPLQWYRPKAERIYKKTVGCVCPSTLLSLLFSMLLTYVVQGLCIIFRRSGKAGAGRTRSKMLRKGYDSIGREV